MSTGKIAVMPLDDYQAICDKVRAKTGGTALLKSGEIPSELDKLGEGVAATLGTKTITENGSYSASEDGLDGYSEIEVDIPSVATLGTKVITENGSYSATSEGFDGYSEVEVNIVGAGGTDVSGVTATPDDVLEGAVFVNSQGEEKTGTIPRNGDVSQTFDGIETKSVEIPAGYTTGGTVALDGTIDGHVDDQATLIAQIAEALEGKAAGGGGEPVLDPADVKFGSEAIDPDQLYKVGYNWFARVVAHVQDMVGRTSSFTLEEIVYWLGRVKYIPQGYAESAIAIDTSNFTSSATGILPDVQKGIATSVLAISTSTFTSSAVGVLQEG